MASARIGFPRILQVWLCFALCASMQPSWGHAWTYQQNDLARLSSDILPTKSQVPVVCNPGSLQVDGYGCSVDGSLPGVSSLMCKYPGMYAITCQTAGVQSKRFLRFEDRQDCYTWHVTRVRNEIIDVKPWENLTRYKYGYSMELLHIWIEESNHNVWSRTSLPTAAIKKLNVHFHKKGQRPTILPILNYPFSINVSLSSFDAEFGMWTVEVRRTGTEVVKGYHVKGRPITFNHCVVPDMDALMSGPDLEPVNDTETMSFGSFASAGNLFEIIKDWKYPNTFIFMNGDNISVTNDAFHSNERFRINSTEEYQIKSMAFMDHSLVMLSTTGKVLRGVFRRNHLYPTLFQATLHDVDTEVLGVTALPGSLGIKLGQHEIGAEHWLYWTQDNIYQCKADLCNRILIDEDDVSDIGFQNECFIVSALYDGAFEEDIAVTLACKNNALATDRKLIFGIYNGKRDSWNMTALDMSYDATSSYRITYVGHHNLQIFSSPLEVFYISDGGIANVKVQERDTLKNLQEVLEAGDKLVDVVSYGGKIVYHTSQNVLLYGHSTVDYILKLEPWLEKSTQAHAWFDDLGRLHLVTLEPTGPVDSIYPLDMEVNSVLLGMGHPPCPYNHFLDGGSPDQVHIDKNQEVVLETNLAALVDNDRLEVSVQMSINNPQFFASTESSQTSRTGRRVFHKKAVLSYSVSSMGNTTYDDYKDFIRCISPAIILQSMQIKCSEARKYDSGEHSSAATVLTFEPSNTTLHCKDPKAHVVNVYGGCPANKYISIKRDAGGCQFFEKISLLSEHSESLNTTRNGSSVQKTYLWNKWGCPVMVHIEEKYVPQLVLMDGDREIRPVSENFVIYEIFNQTIEYTATETQVHCSRPAQNWQKMTQDYLARNISNNATLDSVDVRDKIWGPWNYQSCFDTEPSPAGGHDSESHYNLKLPYEVLNRSGLSAITFKKDRNQVYVFRATVVDPSSYCILQTEFSVQTHGAVMETSSVVASVATIGTFLFICLVSLVVLYFYFTKSHSLFDDEEEEQADS